MLRPLDEALIDFEKTYRQIFKEPLYEHQQYTKRQLIYNYAGVGSEFIQKTLSNKNQAADSSFLDLEQVIKQWNDPLVKVEQIGQEKTKVSKKSQAQFEEDEDARNFRRDVDALKKQKMIIKSRTERNLHFRKQLQVLFKARNINMLSVDSMRSHFSQIKPYISFNSRNRVRSSRDGEGFSSRQNEDYRQSSNRRKQYFHRDRESQGGRQNYRKNDLYGRQNQRKEEIVNMDASKTIIEDFQELPKSKPDIYEKQSQGYFPMKASSPYFSNEQYAPQMSPYSGSQFARNDGTYSKYSPTIEISSSHNQNYQPSAYQRRIFPPPPPTAQSQSNSFYQYDPSANSQYGVYRSSSNDINKHYQNQ